MGIFSNDDQPSSSNTSTTVIAHGTRIQGTLTLECDIHVDGYIEGKLKTTQTLVVGKEGRINGEVYANRILVSGLVEGECAGKAIEILASGHVKGTIYSSDLSIEKGGRFIGETKEEESAKVISSIDEAKVKKQFSDKGKESAQG